MFNVQTAEWIQTINLRQAVPLTRDGLLTRCEVNDFPYVVVLADVLSGQSETYPQRGLDEDAVLLPMISVGASRQKPRRRKFSIRSAKDDEKGGKVGDRRSALPISGPSDFVHVAHMGPGKNFTRQAQLFKDFRSIIQYRTKQDLTGQGLELQNLIDVSPQTQGGVKGMIPMMRSTSTNSANLNAVHAISSTKKEFENIVKNRPLSSHSKSSDGMFPISRSDSEVSGSSLGRDGKMSTCSSDNQYTVRYRN